MPATPMLLCYIAWMKKYRGTTATDQPVGGGSNPEKEERFNFKDFGGHMYGYVPSVSRGRPPSRTISVRRLGAAPSADIAVGATVVWTATRPNGGRFVVGWYKQAEVYHKLQKHAKRGWYNIRASAENSVLIKPSQRRDEIEAMRPGRPGISAVWFPEGQYGVEVRRMVDRLICQEFDRKRLETSAIELENALRLDDPPPGVKRPISQTKRVTVRGRDPDVWRFTLRRADGTCELCEKPAPFHIPEGRPFLEVHHVKPLAEEGPDTIDNTVALCPNCHREAHRGTDKADIRKRLRNLRQPER